MQNLKENKKRKQKQAKLFLEMLPVLNHAV